MTRPSGQSPCEGIALTVDAKRLATMPTEGCKQADSAADEGLNIEVVYVSPDEALRIKVQLTIGARVINAVEASGILQLKPQWNLADLVVGIHGKLCSLDDPLRAFDRLEIYRPLTMNPKDSRRKRAAKRTRD